MEINNRITPAIIAAATNLLQPYCPDLNPRNLISAIKSWESEPAKNESAQFEKPLTRFEVADLLGVSMPTVNRMMNDGRLRKIKLTIHGAVRIDPKSVRMFLETGV